MPRSASSRREAELAQKKVSTVSREQRLAWIEREGSEVPLTIQSELLGISRSSLYYQPREPTASEIAVKHRIDELSTESPFSGSRRITA
jgi:putative transposase